ncbi:MAG: glycine cleavage system protein GcvH [Candidatus Omnitrophica bacterium]|nr:glycine cleavage system protein GcvH [Candidatus Omnitrophota bacterium]
MIPEDLKYTEKHEWVKLEGDKVTIGITDYAQGELGDITFIELPSSGSSVNQSDSIATVESVKAASDVYAPVSGEILEVNESLEGAPETINQSPYENGWMCKVKVSDETQLDGLMDAAGYGAYLEGLK